MTTTRTGPVYGVPAAEALKLTPYTAANLPAGWYVGLGASLYVKTGPGPDAAWRDDAGGGLVDQLAVDELLARGAIVVDDDGGQHQPLNDTLAAGLAWLYDIEQPADALVTHLGAPVHHRQVGDRRLRFYPDGGGMPIVVSDVVGSRYDPDRGRYVPAYRGATERGLMHASLAHLGRPVADTWNGERINDSASYRLFDMIHPSLRAAREYYGAGCPEHAGTPFCGQDKRDCPWFRDGASRTLHPAWPGVPAPVGAGDGPH